MYKHIISSSQLFRLSLLKTILMKTLYGFVGEEREGKGERGWGGVGDGMGRWWGEGRG